MRISDWSSDVFSSDLLITQFAHFQLQFLPIDCADLFLELVKSPRLETAPGALFFPRRIHDDVVGMELRVLGAAGAVLEARDYQIAGGLATDRAAGADAGGGHMSLDMGHRGPDRFAMCEDRKGTRL